MFWLEENLILMTNMLKKCSKSAQQVFNWSEFYFSKMTCYKILTLVSRLSLHIGHFFIKCNSFMWCCKADSSENFDSQNEHFTRSLKLGSHRTSGNEGGFVVEVESKISIVIWHKSTIIFSLNDYFLYWFWKLWIRWWVTCCVDELDTSTWQYCELMFWICKRNNIHMKPRNLDSPCWPLVTI